MKKINILATLSALILSAFMASCAESPTTENSQEQQPQKVGTVFIGTNAIKLADNATRTSVDYTFGENSFKFFWEPGDKIWILNYANPLTTDITKRFTRARFTSSDNYPLPNTVQINYTGQNTGSDRNVIIQSTQNQDAPNSTAHFGDSGDCGIGTATKQSNGEYTFTLEHKAAYLCLLPRTPNGLTSTVITQVKVTSDKDIAGATFLGTTELRELLFFSQKTITITLNSGNGFPLNNAQTSQATNAIYAVIHPNTHALTIEYTLKDTHTNVQTTVTKTIPSQNYEPNTLTPITANLALPTPPTPKFYLWDAQQDYWWNHLNADGTPDGNYPQDPSDPRWYHKNSNPHAVEIFEATQSCRYCPNANELWWYAKKGDPRWDNQAYVRVENGHIYAVCGLWLRKKRAIVAYLKSIGYPAYLTEANLRDNYRDTPTAAPIDYRTTWGQDFPTPTQGRPANTADYFFLPAWGYYTSGLFFNLWGGSGYYWGSSASPISHTQAYGMSFRSNQVGVGTFSRSDGGIVQTFE